MADTDKKNVVSVKHLTKTFKIPTEASSGIKQKIINAAKGKKGYREFTPLKDISFDINEGDFFGIVGRNGSGKSTLLKSIANIYMPTKGSVHVSGKLVPFIELGVGFNPELTGRENVFLNGALLGFSHDEMEDMYDAIVDFSEIGEFMDEKLKNYSSGMQVRLAFSIAIRAEGDILLLDEVLAVGDEAFQKKCFDYFEELKKDKKTVILVSHDMGAVKRFCNKAILIEDGEIKMSGTPDDIANQYSMDNLNSHSNHNGDSVVLSEPITGLRIVSQSKSVLHHGDDLIFDIEVKHSKDIDDLYIGISLLYRNVSLIEHGTAGIEPYDSQDGVVTYRYNLPVDRFEQGDFTISAAVLNIESKALVAFTTQTGNYVFKIVKSKEPAGGVLVDRGKWVQK